MSNFEAWPESQEFPRRVGVIALEQEISRITKTSAYGMMLRDAEKAAHYLQGQRTNRRRRDPTMITLSCENGVSSNTKIGGWILSQRKPREGVEASWEDRYQSYPGILVSQWGNLFKFEGEKAKMLPLPTSWESFDEAFDEIVGSTDINPFDVRGPVGPERVADIWAQKTEHMVARVQFGEPYKLYRP